MFMCGKFGAASIAVVFGTAFYSSIGQGSGVQAQHKTPTDTNSNTKSRC